jgi:hypothetical protein
MKMTVAIALAGVLAASALQVRAQGCSARSPAHTVALVELFTSEGCSSCPPADEFLASRRSAGLRADQAVMLSLHVDYWNAIGWKDPYSHAAFTARQRWLSDLAHTRTIYTPEFFVAGKELRNWGAALEPTIKQVNATPAQASIAIALGPAGTGGTPVQFSAGGPPGARLYTAMVQSGLATSVGAGENSGRMLRHDYVVRDWAVPVTLGADGKAAHARTVAIPRGAAASRYGVVAFVQAADGKVLQALSLDACGS